MNKKLLKIGNYLIEKKFTLVGKDEWSEEGNMLMDVYNSSYAVVFLLHNGIINICFSHSEDGWYEIEGISFQKMKDLISIFSSAKYRIN